MCNSMIRSFDKFSLLQFNLFTIIADPIQAYVNIGSEKTYLFVWFLAELALIYQAFQKVAKC